jgi:hypothetical protein
MKLRTRIVVGTVMVQITDERRLIVGPSPDGNVPVLTAEGVPPVRADDKPGAKFAPIREP